MRVSAEVTRFIAIMHWQEYIYRWLTKLFHSFLFIKFSLPSKSFITTCRRTLPLPHRKAMENLLKEFRRLFIWASHSIIFLSLLLLLPSATSFYNYLRSVKYYLSLFFFKPADVKGKVVLITGASSGIGQCMAWEYAKKGAMLVLVARRKNKLKQVADECVAFGATDCVSCPADLSSSEDCKRIVDFAISTFGRLDVLVNNAGTAGGALFEDWKNVDDYKKVMELDFWGHVHTTHFALEHLRKTKGQILVTSSMSALIPFPYLTVYSAAKGALVNFFETLRIEEFDKSISVTVASPGFVQSELTSKELPGKIPEWLPLPKAEDTAREIVEKSLRKERHVITPKWYTTFLWFRVLVPESLDWMCRVFLLGKPPSLAIENLCRSLGGESGTQKFFRG